MRRILLFFGCHEGLSINFDTPSMVLVYIGAKLAIKFKKGYKFLTKIEFDGNKNTNCSSLSSLNML